MDCILLPREKDYRTLVDEKWAEIFRDCYATLSEEDQCSAFHLIGLLACAGAGTLESKHASNRGARDGTCSLCDAGSVVRLIRAIWDDNRSEEIFLTVLNLLKGSHVQRSTKPRVAAMVSLRKLIMHTENVAYLDLAQSYLGQWCLQSLRSSLRELRISAGFVCDAQSCFSKILIEVTRRTLAAFLRTRFSEELLRKNRIAALDFLRTLTDKNEPLLQETCILAWGQVAS